MDLELGRLSDLGCQLGITADHGMNDKCREDGTPRVIYLEDELTKEFGEGNKVICPITDPYVAHHGALGSYVTVHLAEPGRANEIAEWTGGLEGVTEVLGKIQAADLLTQN